MWKINIVRDIQGLYNTVILKDVIARYKITDVMMLEDIATVRE